MLQEELIRRIESKGKLTFAEFMELALYWPDGGYYASPAPTAPDYFTAPMAHPVFGALLAMQLEEMWERMGCPKPFVVIELGAGSGQLAKDITSYALNLHPPFSNALLYVAVERAARSMGGRFQSVASVGLPFHNIVGCILSNELLDAIPVHRISMDQGQLREIYVTHRDGQFVECHGELSTSALAVRLESEGVSLGEAQRAEVCLGIEPWVKEASQALERGFMLTIDYGHEARDLYSPQRYRGTLRCYYQHTLSANPYVHLGKQDITSHVDFTAVAQIGERYGLTSGPLTTQAAFLRNLGLQAFQRGMMKKGLGQRERDANRMAMLELARPDGMGDFKVLVQSSGVDATDLTGVSGASSEWKRRVEALPVPLLDAEHLPLMEARYPHASGSFEGLWS